MAAAATSVTQIGANKCFGGVQRRFKHSSASTSCEMVFSLFVPGSASSSSPAPVVVFLSGLTCTDQNFVTKAGAQRYAAELGLAIACPDTSPRGDEVPNDDAYDLGQGASFYLDASEAPYSTHFRMEQYVTTEFVQAVAAASDAVDTSRMSVYGHSMGGHGALTLFLRHPHLFRSVSAFAPICNPVACPWGQKAFAAYLGGSADSHDGSWAGHDACELVGKYDGPPATVLIHQGADDEFLAKGQLLPTNLIEAAKGTAVSIEYHEEPGYDHSYFFVASFQQEHLAFHAKALLGEANE